VFACCYGRSEGGRTRGICKVGRVTVANAVGNLVKHVRKIARHAVDHLWGLTGIHLNPLMTSMLLTHCIL
jgi:hypothetical protein